MNAQSFTGHPTLSEIRFAGLIAKTFNVDVFGGVTDLAMRRETARQTLAQPGRAAMRATKGQTFGFLFRAVYGHEITP